MDLWTWSTPRCFQTSRWNYHDSEGTFSKLTIVLQSVLRSHYHAVHKRQQPTWGHRPIWHRVWCPNWSQSWWLCSGGQEKDILKQSWSLVCYLLNLTSLYSKYSIYPGAWSVLKHIAHLTRFGQQFAISQLLLSTIGLAFYPRRVQPPITTFLLCHHQHHYCHLQPRCSLLL